MKVNLFISGFSKCGTTTLFDILKTDPNIKEGLSKEPSFFSQIVGFNENKSYITWSVSGRYKKGIEWYQKLYEGLEAKYLLDASTIYGFDEGTPKLIYDYNKNAKIIFVVRNPYKRIESHYYQELKNGMNLPSLKDLILENHERFQFYLKCTNYKKTIQNYINYFGEENVLVVSQSSLNDVESLSTKLSNFLDIDLKLQNVNLQSNKRKTSKFPLLKNMLIRIERSHLAFVAPVFLQQIGSRVMRKIDDFLLKEMNDVPVIESEIIDFVNNLLEEDLIYLNEKFNIKV